MRQELVNREAALTALTKHPSWETLVAEMERKRERIEKVVLAKALVAHAPVDPVEMAYWHGLVDGIEWILKRPSAAEAKLERALRELQREQRSEGVGVE